MTASKQTDIFSFVSGGEDITITLADIKNYFCANATDQECVLFGQLCKANGLNPWLKEAYLIKYDKNAPAAMVTGKDAYMKRANEHPAFDGYEAGREGSTCRTLARWSTAKVRPTTKTWASS